MANKLNTKKIGDDFEIKSLRIIEKLIKDEQIGPLEKYLKIYSKKKYYSHIKGGNVEFDIAIEHWPPNASNFTMLYLVECKNYKTSVPVGKINEFHSKIQQVSGVNVKGIFITNSPLQKGGFRMAENIGMMVIIAESGTDFKIMLHKSNKGSNSKNIPFIKELYHPEYIDDGFTYIENMVDSLLMKAFYKCQDISRVGYGIDKLSKNDIELISKAELKKINPLIIGDAMPLTAKGLTNYLIKNYEVDIIKINKNSDLLGSCKISSNEIGINESIIDTKRELFILAHEFGHYILHQKLLINQEFYNSFQDSKYNFTIKKHNLINPKHWIEWQANYFSSCMILPKYNLIARLYSFQERYSIRKGKIYVDDKYHNQNDFHKLIAKLSQFFNVSKTSIIYRLNEFDLIDDQTNLKSISQIMHEHKATFNF